MAQASRIRESQAEERRGPLHTLRMPRAAEWDLSQTGTEIVFFLGPSALENGFIQEAVKPIFDSLKN